MTRAERRKRLLVWRKTAPINAPHYEMWRHGRYVPAHIPGAPNHGSTDAEWHAMWGVHDRVLGRILSSDELKRVRDVDLEYAVFRPN